VFYCSEDCELKDIEHHCSICQFTWTQSKDGGDVGTRISDLKKTDPEHVIEFLFKDIQMMFDMYARTGNLRNKWLREGLRTGLVRLFGVKTDIFDRTYPIHALRGYVYDNQEIVLRGAPGVDMFGLDDQPESKSFDVALQKFITDCASQNYIVTNVTTAKRSAAEAFVEKEEDLPVYTPPPAPTFLPPPAPVVHPSPPTTTEKLQSELPLKKKKHDEKQKEHKHHKEHHHKEHHHKDKEPRIVRLLAYPGVKYTSSNPIGTVPSDLHGKQFGNPYNEVKVEALKWAKGPAPPNFDTKLNKSDFIKLNTYFKKGPYLLNKDDRTGALVVVGEETLGASAVIAEKTLTSRTIFEEIDKVALAESRIIQMPQKTEALKSVYGTYARSALEAVLNGYVTSMSLAASASAAKVRGLKRNIKEKNMSFAVSVSATTKETNGAIGIVPPFSSHVDRFYEKHTKLANSAIQALLHFLNYDIEAIQTCLQHMDGSPMLGTMLVVLGKDLSPLTIEQLDAVRYLYDVLIRTGVRSRDIEYTYPEYTYPAPKITGRRREILDELMGLPKGTSLEDLARQQAHYTAPTPTPMVQSKSPQSSSSSSPLQATTTEEPKTPPTPFEGGLAWRGTGPRPIPPPPTPHVPVSHAPVPAPAPPIPSAPPPSTEEIEEKARLAKKDQEDREFYRKELRRIADERIAQEAHRIDTTHESPEEIAKEAAAKMAGVNWKPFAQIVLDKEVQILGQTKRKPQPVAKATNFASEIDADSEDVELKYYATPHTPYEVPQEKGNKEPGEGEGDGALVVVGEQTLPLGKRAKYDVDMFGMTRCLQWPVINADAQHQAVLDVTLRSMLGDRYFTSVELRSMPGASPELIRMLDDKEIEFAISRGGSLGRYTEMGLVPPKTPYDQFRGTHSKGSNSAIQAFLHYLNYDVPAIFHAVNNDVGTLMVITGKNFSALDNGVIDSLSEFFDKLIENAMFTRATSTFRYRVPNATLDASQLRIIKLVSHARVKLAEPQPEVEEVNLSPLGDTKEKGVDEHEQEVYTKMGEAPPKDDLTKDTTKDTTEESKRKLKNLHKVKDIEEVEETKLYEEQVEEGMPEEEEEGEQEEEEQEEKETKPPEVKIAKAAAAAAAAAAITTPEDSESESEEISDDSEEGLDDEEGEDEEKEEKEEKMEEVEELPTGCQYVPLPWVVSLCICGKEAVAVCGRCGKIAYCSKRCQIDHWRKSHKYECALLRIGEISVGVRYTRETQQLDRFVNEGCTTTNMIAIVNEEKSTILKDSERKSVLKPSQREKYFKSVKFYAIPVRTAFTPNVRRYFVIGDSVYFVISPGEAVNKNRPPLLRDYADFIAEHTEQLLTEVYAEIGKPMPIKFVDAT